MTNDGETGEGKLRSSADRKRYLAFYESSDLKRVGRDEMPEQRETTRRWLESEQACANAGVTLELGCGRGALAGVHSNYVGLELSRAAIRSRRCNSSIVNGDMQELPFRSESVAFIFSWAALEHVPRPELVLDEVRRVLKPGGIALLAPAWNCRPWAAKGLPIKAYRDLDWMDRVEKATIPVRDSLWWRAAWAFPKRLVRELKTLQHQPIPFEYRRLTPNLEEYVYTDCDAFTSMDPHAAIVYFESRGWQVLSHRGLWARLRSRHEPVVVRKPLYRAASG